jgi:hypothetical protein
MGDGGWGMHGIDIDPIAIVGANLVFARDVWQ